MSGFLGFLWPLYKSCFGHKQEAPAGYEEAPASPLPSPTEATPLTLGTSVFSDNRAHLSGQVRQRQLTPRQAEEPDLPDGPFDAQPPSGAHPLSKAKSLSGLDN